MDGLHGNTHGLGAAHDDVLHAEPASEESRHALVEEIKNRAK
jgi:hypothetical protein